MITAVRTHSEDTEVNIHAEDKKVVTERENDFARSIDRIERLIAETSAERAEILPEGASALAGGTETRFEAEQRTIATIDVVCYVRCRHRVGIDRTTQPLAGRTCTGDIPRFQAIQLLLDVVRE